MLCTESCLNAFLADPGISYKVHRNSEKTVSELKVDRVALTRHLRRTLVQVGLLKG